MINPVQVHLALNHAPLFGVVCGMGLVAAGLVRKSRELQGAGLIAFMLSALLSILVTCSGERAEEVIEGAPGVAETAIHRHEEAAEAAFVAVDVLGIAAAGIFFWSWRVRPAAPAATWTIFLVALITLGLMARAAHLGGEIRHPELHASGTGAP